MQEAPEHTLEFLLAFAGRRHWYAGGYYAKFEIKRVLPTRQRPHGLRYRSRCTTRREHGLVGFDNAHGVPAAGSRFSKRPTAADHGHQTEDDPGRPYAFTDAATLVDDFFDEIERVLTDRGVPLVVIEDSDGRGERRS